MRTRKQQHPQLSRTPWHTMVWVLGAVPALWGRRTRRPDRRAAAKSEPITLTRTRGDAADWVFRSKLWGVFILAVILGVAAAATWFAHHHGPALMAAVGALLDAVVEWGTDQLEHVPVWVGGAPGMGQGHTFAVLPHFMSV